MKQLHFVLILEVFTPLALIYGGALAQRMRINAKYLRAPHTSRQLAPYPAAGQRPAVQFALPTEQITEAPTQQVEGTITAQLNEKDEATDEDLAEDLDPIAADAAEDDTEPLPEPEEQINTKGEEEEGDENADIIPERRAGPSPSKRYWFFRK